MRGDFVQRPSGTSFALNFGDRKSVIFVQYCGESSFIGITQ